MYCVDVEQICITDYLPSGQVKLIMFVFKKKELFTSTYLSSGSKCELILVMGWWLLVVVCISGPHLVWC